jgi:hypothetical protein
MSNQRQADSGIADESEFQGFGISGPMQSTIS